MKLSDLPEFSPSREDDVFIIRDGYTNWAKGKTLREAIANLGPPTSQRWSVWSVHPSTVCHSSFWTYPENHIPNMLAQSTEQKP